MANGLDYGYAAVIAGMLALLLVLIYWMEYKITKIEKKLNIIIASFKKSDNADDTASQDKNPQKAKKE